MEFELTFSDKEVEAINTKHVECWVFGYVKDGAESVSVIRNKKVRVRARGYGGLSAVVNIDDAPVDESKKEA